MIYTYGCQVGTSKKWTLLTYFQAPCGSQKLRVWICIYYISIYLCPVWAEIFNRTSRLKTGQSGSKPDTRQPYIHAVVTVANLCCCCRHCRWLCITSFPVAYKQRVVLSWCIPGWGVWGAEENPILWVTWFCVTVMDHCLASDHVGCCSNISVLVCQWYFSAESESLVYHVLLN